MNWLYLAGAVIFEIAVAFAASKADGFAHRGWTAATLGSGAVATFLLSRALLTFDVGVGYALWTSIAGVGIVVVGALVLGQRLTKSKALGIGVVIVGVIGLQLSGAA
jgi:quaternary ammonium compound-resistance protein SugE